MTNQFDSKGGEQNIGQGDHAIGKQVNNYGIPPEVFAEYAGKLAVTDSALASFFKILEEQQVPLHDLDSKLREIAGQYKELLARVGDDQAAKQAIEAGDYAKAEKLLDDVANQHSLAAAKAHADNARLQEVQLRYAKAAAYWQKAAALLPEESKKERADYLNSAGHDLKYIGKDTEALSLYERSLAICQEIREQAWEGRVLNNISQIYHERGDYATALKYLEQSLHICRELGHKAGEGITLNGISQIYKAQGNYAIAMSYLEQSLHISQEIGDKEGEDCALNNISQVYDARGDYATALKYLEQALAVQQELGNMYGRVHTCWNIGRAYEKQGNIELAEAYMSCAVQLEEKIGYPYLEQDRKHLEAVRAKLRSK